MRLLRCHIENFGAVRLRLRISGGLAVICRENGFGKKHAGSVFEGNVLRPPRTGAHQCDRERAQAF